MPRRNVATTRPGSSIPAYGVFRDSEATSGRNSPLRGRKMSGQVIATFYAGHPTVLDARLNEPAVIGANQ